MSRRDRLVIAMAGWLGYLPVPVLVVLGWLCGLLFLLPLARRRRRVALTNLRLCYPQHGGWWRAWLLVRHFALLGRFVLDHAFLLSTSRRRLVRWVRLVGLENLRAVRAPIILAVPHFLGLNHGYVRFSQEMATMGVYQPQHSKLGEAIVYKSRQRLARTEGISTRAPVVRLILRCLKAGQPVYYLSDMDYRGVAKHVFVPFLGMPTAATLTTLPRLARLAGAVIVPCVTRMRWWGGYEVRLGQPWQDWPSGDDTADVRRFNEFVAAEIKRSPAQYYWIHRRFKTQPQGGPAVYG